MNNEMAESIEAAREFTRAANKLAQSDAETFEKVVRILDCEKPKTKLIHGVEVPDISFSPDDLDRYYYPDAAYEKMVYNTEFIDENVGDIFRSEHGLCYPYTTEGKASAILHAKAMLGIAEKTAVSVKPQTSLLDKMRKEHQELSDNMAKLEAFMHRDTFAALTPVNQGLLMVQLEAMRMYATTLERRIEIS